MSMLDAEIEGFLVTDGVGGVESVAMGAAHPAEKRFVVIDAGNSREAEIWVVESFVWRP